MAYIGNTVQNQGFSPAVDYFNGNGVTVTFTLSRPVASVAQMIVAVDNVIQNPSSAFSVVGNSITFTSAPLSGTNNIWVEYTSLITTYQGISQDPTVIGDIRATGGYLAEGDFGNSFIDGNLIDYVTGRGRFTVGELDNITFYHGGTGARSEMMDLYYAGGAKIYGTTALTIPVGTTAERPGTPAAGMVRMNSTTGYPEWYSTVTSTWVQFNNTATYSVEYLVIAGGASGGAQHGGGGGAGGYRSSVSGESSGGGASAESPLSLIPGTAYTVTVGAGGASVYGATSPNKGINGSNSVFATITSTGGGAGGGWNDSGGAYGGYAGGSGGGSSLTGTGGAGTSGQGYVGGATGASPTFPNGGSGGGGAGAAGQSAYNLSKAGDGGTGVSSSINGSATTRAGGGGGGSHSPSTIGYGGSGGGGNGGLGNNGSPTGDGVAGTTNTGGGGGGSGSNTSYSGAGGSGIVIIRYLGAQRGTGGTVTSSGGYTIHTFTSSGTYTA
jgi:hypothetical protein